MTVRRSLWMVLVTVLAASACSDATGPEALDANGQWAGSFTHPAYDGGSLSMVLTDANGAVEGTYRLRLTRVGSNGRAFVEQSGGRIMGSSSNGRLTLRMLRSNGEEWLLEGRLGEASAQGDWSTTRGVRGTFAVNR